MDDEKQDQDRARRRRLQVKKRRFALYRIKRELLRKRESNDYVGMIALLRSISEERDFLMMMRACEQPIIGCPDIGGAENAAWIARLPKFSFAMLMNFAGLVFDGVRSAEADFSHFRAAKIKKPDDDFYPIF